MPTSDDEVRTAPMQNPIEPSNVDTTNTTNDGIGQMIRLKTGPPLVSEGATIATLNRNGDGTTQTILQKLGPKSSPLKKATPFKGEGKRASGRVSIGTVRARQQFDIDNAADQLTKNAISQAKESLDITKKTAATKIQSAVRNRNARHELDKSVTARVQRMENDLTRSQGNMNQ